MLHLRALGTPSMEVGGGPARGAGAQRKPLALLSLLAVAGERGLSRDRIQVYLWPESAADRAAHRLTQLLYAIRRDLRADRLFQGSTDLRLDPELIGSDIATFSEALGRGDYTAAVAAYGGPFLDGFFLNDAPEFERWVEGERTRLARRHADALEALAISAEHAGDAAAAAEWWRRRVDCEPTNSRAVARCMEALATLGERAEALRLARAHQAVMQEELQAPADPLVLAAVERLLARPASGPAPAPSPVAPATSIAVLPFQNLSPDRESEYFSDGLTEDLIDALARVPGLRVAARSSSFAFKGKPTEARELGERLAVGSLVEGSVRKVGRRIRLSVRLVSTADGYQRWSETYERTVEDVLALQEELAAAIVCALPLAVPVTPVSRTAAATRDAEAYTLYLRGRYAALKRTVEGFPLAVEYFEQATERDPTYALAHAGLAEAWALSGFAEYGQVPPAIAMPKARAAALAAQRLDPALPEPHIWLGVVRLLYDWDPAGAEAAMRRALELAPQSAYAHTWYAVYLAVMHRFAEAIAAAERAQAIEPLALTLQIVTARVHYWSGRPDRAREMLEAMRLAEPSHTTVVAWLARALALTGDADRGLRVLTDLAERARTPYVLGLEALLRASLGQHQQAGALCDTAEAASEGWTYVAAARVMLGQPDRAVAALERMFAARSGLLVFCGVDQLLLPLVRDPGASAVLRRLGLPMRGVVPAGVVS
jgi:TolB-like protein/DNA-binding SARP family transcriptional activator/Flp pilus assembly protein TadD